MSTVSHDAWRAWQHVRMRVFAVPRTPVVSDHAPVVVDYGD